MSIFDPLPPRLPTPRFRLGPVADNDDVSPFSFRFLSLPVYVRLQSICSELIAARRSPFEVSEMSWSAEVGGCRDLSGSASCNTLVIARVVNVGATGMKLIINIQLLSPKNTVIFRHERQ